MSMTVTHLLKTVAEHHFIYCTNREQACRAVRCTENIGASMFGSLGSGFGPVIPKLSSVRTFTLRFQNNE